MEDVRKKREPSLGCTEEPPLSGAFKSSDKKRREIKTKWSKLHQARYVDLYHLRDKEKETRQINKRMINKDRNCL